MFAPQSKFRDLVRLKRPRANPKSEEMLASGPQQKNQEFRNVPSHCFLSWGIVIVESGSTFVYKIGSDYRGCVPALWHRLAPFGGSG